MLLLLDVDGVVLVGDDPAPYAAEGIARLRGLGARIAFVTNNVTTPRSSLLRRLAGVSGIAEPNICDPIDVLLDCHRDLLDPPRSWQVLGGTQLQRECEARVGRLQLRKATASAVLVGSVIALDYNEIVAACRSIASGAAFVATGMDRSFHWKGLSWPGVGSLVRFLEYTTGAVATVLGKPNPQIFELALRRLGEPEALVVGNDLEMDVAGGARAGCRTALISSGEWACESASSRPDLVAPDLGVLAKTIARYGWPSA